MWNKKYWEAINNLDSKLTKLIKNQKTEKDELKKY